MGELLLALLDIATVLVGLFIFAIIASVILSWLYVFNVVNPHNPTVRQIHYFISSLTEPVLRPVRNMLPPMGGVDLSALVVLLVLQFLVIGWLFDGMLRPIFASL